MPDPLRARYVVYADCTLAEHEVIKAQAKKDGLSISDWVRRCVNTYLLELGDDVPLLEERRTKDRVIG